MSVRRISLDHDSRKDREFYTPKVKFNPTVTPPRPIQLPPRYTKVEGTPLGVGAQGVTIKAYDTKTDKFVAIKVSFKTDKSLNGFYKNAVRELKLMRWTNHPNLVELLGAFTTALSEKRSRRHLLRYATVLGWRPPKFHSNLKRPKPLNICYERNSQNEMHICILDFGLARRAPDPTQRLTGNVATPCYRPIEDILPVNKGAYDEKRDIWAVAVTLGELVYRDYLFYDPRDGGRRNTDVEIIRKICRLLGPPTEKYCTGFSGTSYDILSRRIARANAYPATFKTTFGDAEFDSKDLDENQTFRDFLQELFRYEPDKRPGAAEALKHPYFASNYNALPERFQQSEHIREILDSYPNEMEDGEVEDKHGNKQPLTENYYKEVLFGEILTCESHFKVFS